MGCTTKQILTDVVIPSLTAFGTVAVAILAIWGNWFQRKFAPARLVIEPHNNFQGSQTTWGHRNPDGTVACATDAYFFHAKVVNKRRWIAPSNCQVLLRALSKRNAAGDFVPVPLTIPFQHVWSPKEFSPIYVSVEDERVFDFGILVKENDRFHPVHYIQHNDFEGDIKANEAVRYSLQIVSDRFVSETYQVFEVTWDGQWDDNPTEMGRHLVIKEIKERGLYFTP